MASTGRNRLRGGGRFQRRFFGKPSHSAAKVRRVGLVGVLSALLLAVTAVSFAGVARAADTATWIVDPDTHDTWYSNTDGTGVSTQGGDSTKNTGRIWTDKSVYNSNVQLSSTGGESTFTVENDEGTALVSLSALSSAANISGQTAINQPLDIVLVLDRSGSMADDMVSYEYSETYNVQNNGTYYIQNDEGTYIRIERHNFGGMGIFRPEDWGWRRTDTDERVYNMTSAQDPDSSHVQFYTRRQVSNTSRMQALKTAVNNFIDSVAEQNNGKEQTQQHRISIVSYASGARVDADFTLVAGNNADTLKRRVNNLNANGGTYSDDAMETANTVMEGGRYDGERYDGARETAKQVVIFFTDGGPGGTTTNPFNGTTANNTIREAQTLKNNGTTIYSIGVFEGANPSDTSDRMNAYMHGVSSNYLHAQSYQQLGVRNPDGKDYYFAAEDAESLNNVFQSIYDDFGTGATSPIENTTSIGGENIGYLTFTDTLGSYMEVKNFKAIVFAGKEFTQVSSSESGDGTSTTYTFQGTVNNGTDEGVVYPGDHDLSTIEITVSHDSALEQGDTVTVKIPSNLIPLRLYTAESNTVDGETTTTTSVRDAYPIRVFYTVGLKSDVMDGDNIDASKLSTNYIATHTDDDGNVYFLSNAYSGGAAGTTTATFQPATTNSFYYFTEDTPIYTAESTDSPAGGYQPGRTYYYQRSYYAESDLHTEWVSFTAQQGQLGQYVQYNPDSGTYYIREGAPRLTRAAEFEAAKSPNTTGTATEAIGPSWVGANVVVSLGNNGKISYPVSGSLQISKTVDWGNTGAEHNDKEFTYTVDFGGADTAVSGTFDYVKYNAVGQPLDSNGGVQQVESGAQPAATSQIVDGDTLTLKNGEHVVVRGLPVNTSFTVTETDAAGFTASNTVDGTASAVGAVAAGTIQSNKTSDVAYTNTYSVRPVDFGNDADGSIKGTKTLSGRDWYDGEKYTFVIEKAQNSPADTPMPVSKTVDVTSDGSDAYGEGSAVPFHFGKITYTKAGTYTYVVREWAKSPADPGMTYSGARYIVTVTVADDGQGNLTQPQVSMVQSYNDGGSVNDPQRDASTAAFVNTFGGNDAATAIIEGMKEYTDNTGTNPNNTPGKFRVTITPTGDAPGTTEMVDVGVNGTFNSTTNLGLVFDIDDVGKTYTYEVKEVVPAGAVDNDNGTATLDGMTYDTHAETVAVGVTQDQQSGSIVATVNYDEDGCLFKNTYTADSTTTDENENAKSAMTVIKQLDGAAGDENQFTFTMVAADDPTAKAIENGWVTGIDADGNEKKTTAIEKDGSQSIAFDALTFTHPGTFSFNVTEVQDTENSAWSYDDHTYNVKFTVEDQGGKLVITSVQAAGGATFTNKYTASMDYDKEAGGIWFSKTLNGRKLTANQFSFTVGANENDSDSISKLAEVETSLTNELGANDGTESVWHGISGLTFDQDDAGKTFTFVVTEQKGAASGYTYDEQPVTIQIAVTDDGDGTMSTTTTVTKGDTKVTYNSADFKSDDNSTFPTAPFVNSYMTSVADPVSVNFEKHLTGREWKETDNFEFTLSANTELTSVPEDVLTAAMPANVTKNVTGANADKTFSFGDFTFTQKGTYVYDVKETQPSEGAATQGITYDTNTARVIFTVTDNGTGKLQVSSSITGIGLTDDGAGVFTNKYSAKGELSLVGTKKLEGRDFKFGDTFTFTVNASADVPKPNGLTNIHEDGTSWTGTVTIEPKDGNEAEINFGSVEITKAGEYSYLITEQNTDIDGMSYDMTTHTVTFRVEDDGRGGFTVTQTAGELTWINKAAFEMGDPVSVTGTKTMTGQELTKEQFTFKVEPQDGAPMGEGTQAVFNGEPTQNGDGSWTAQIDLLKKVSFDSSGSYVYLVSERNDGQPGIIYDATQYKITITVAQDGSTNTKIERFTDGEEWVVATEVAFNNSYASDDSATLDGSANLNGTKTLSGRDWTNTDSFTFVLAAGNDDTQQAIDNDVIYTTETMKTVQGVFSEGAQVPFSFGDIVFEQAGTYVFTISEQQPGDEGFVGPTDGMTYDDHVRTITVTVADNGRGQLVAAATTVGSSSWINTYEVGGDEPVILSGAENLMVTKVIDGRDWQEGDSFTFTLTADGSNPEGVTLPENADGLTITNETEGHKAAFGDITFTQPGNYKFYVNEQVPAEGEGLGGMTYDSAQRVIEVSVVDNGDGTMEVAATVTTPAAGLTFTNTYSNNGEATLPGESNLSVTKQLDGREWVDGDSFTFTLEANDGTTASAIKNGKIVMPAGELSVSGSTENHTAAFGNITFTEEGTYSFKITEVPDNAPGMHYDSHARVVVVNVVDNGEGQLVATLSNEESTGSSTFVNTYEPSFVVVGDNEADIQVTKKVTGAAAPSEFEFKLELTSGNADSIENWPTDGITKSTQDLTGKQDSQIVDFGDITFTKADTYTFTVAEITTTTDGNWDYDNEAKTITVTVTDNNGQLEATVEGNNPTITNAYTEPSTPIDPTPDQEPEDPEPSDPSDPTDSDTDVSKELGGRGLEAGEFTFQIATAEDYGSAVSPSRLTATNAADGSVDFGGGFTFSEEGTYDFVISEVLPSDDDPEADGVQHDGVTYDEATYRATATVEEVDGKLQVTWTVDDAITFTNDYHEPEQPAEPDQPGTPEEPGKPEEGLPGTGDAAPAAIVAVAGIGLVCIAGAVALRKRGEK